jgi:hypothetical protein
MMDIDNGVEVREPAIQIVGRFLGIVVFLVGIAMLGMAFSLAYQAFNDPNQMIPLEQLRAVPPPPPASIYVPLALKLTMLFAMGYLASLIAGRGAHLFFSAKREARRASAGD